MLTRRSFAAVASASLVGAAAPAWGQANSPTRAAETAYAQARNAQLVRDPASPILGNPNGDVTIVEFFDYQCPFTKRVEPRLAAFVEKDGNVALMLKNFPILTRQSRIAAMASLASVRQGKHAPYHRALLAHPGLLDEPDIFTIAKTVGLDADKLRADMTDPKITDHLIDNFNLARAMKATTTPSFIVKSQLLTEPSAKLDFAKIAADARAAKP